LIANAGIMALPKLEQVGGVEKQFATNHLGHFLLVNLLRPQLDAADAARVVVVSSAAHFQAPRAGIEFDNLSGEAGYGAWRAYGQSKLANVLFTRARAPPAPEGFGQRAPSRCDRDEPDAQHELVGDPRDEPVRRAVQQDDPARRRDDLLRGDAPGAAGRQRRVLLQLRGREEESAL
jgi:NAD(P)-dependent dehydrogenase (short-subunit alcohol dehydrogenase family)